MRDLLAASADIRQLAERFAGVRTCLYLGRGLEYPLALEGALKLKEISYIHAEGCAAGEMKHGPIALVDPATLVVTLAPDTATIDSMLSTMQEVKARDGMVLALGTRGDRRVRELADAVIEVPPAPACLQPLLLSVPLQLFAYHLAVCRGCDVDQPRNLAKSVTVE
jgi:glucosamine--fructose-6-phosphate aminotransferase (isomerizing)